MSRREEAIVRLAQCLYETMENLDSPTDGPSVTWDELRDWDREFYKLCVEALMSHNEEIAIALTAPAD